MSIFSEIFIELFIRKIIAGFFGYYTLYGIYFILRSKKGIDWLKKELKDEEAFARSIIVTIVGILSFCLCFYLASLIHDQFFLE